MCFLERKSGCIRGEYWSGNWGYEGGCEASARRYENEELVEYIRSAYKDVWRKEEVRRMVGLIEKLSNRIDRKTLKWFVKVEHMSESFRMGVCVSLRCKVEVIDTGFARGGWTESMQCEVPGA